MRLRLVTVALTAAVGLGALAGPAVAARPTMTPAGVSAFGQSSLVLTLPHGADVPADGALTENGRQVDDVTVTPAARVPGSYGVVLALYTGSNMKGAGMRGQLAAARSFVASHPAGMPLAILTYNRTATVAVPFTTKREPIAAALKQPPPLKDGSHVYDAAAAALDLVAAEKLAGGAVVLLTAANDGGSTTLPAAVAKAAQKRGVWIFGASLAAGSTSAPTLDQLTVPGAGQNLGVMNGPGLKALMRSLGKQTGDASVLSYRSAESPGSRVSLSFEGGDRQVTTSLVMPTGRPTAGADAATTKPEDPSVFASSGGRALVAILVAGLLFGGFWPVVTTMRRRNSMRARIAVYAGSHPAVAYQETGEVPVGRQSLLKGNRIDRLGETLLLARMETPPERLVVQTFVAMIVLGYLTFLISGFALAGLGMFLGVAFIVRAIVRAKLGKQRQLFADQLADSLQAVAAALRGGHSFSSALSTIVEEAAEPTATEFRRIVAAERMGVPLEQAFADTVTRMDNSDVQQVALVAVLQRETGGNAAEALDRVVENLRGRDDVRRLVNTLTSQGRMSRWVLTSIPIGLLTILTLLSSSYMEPLYTTSIGHVALGVAALMCFLGSMAIGKIVDIQV